MAFNILPDDENGVIEASGPVLSSCGRAALANVQFNSPAARAAPSKSKKVKTPQSFFIGASANARSATESAAAKGEQRVILRGFQAPVFVDFGDISLDDGKQTISLVLENDTDTRLTVAKTNINGMTDQGFDIVFATKRSKTVLDAGTEQQCSVTFEPKSFGALREQLVLKLSSRHRCTIIVAAVVIDRNLPIQSRNTRIGKAKTKTKKSAFRRVQVNAASKSKAKPSTSTKTPRALSAKAPVGQQQRASAAAPSTKQRQQPKATKGVKKSSKPLPRGKQLYDSNWDDKQQDGFTSWMNHVLCTKGPLNTCLLYTSPSPRDRG